MSEDKLGAFKTLNESEKYHASISYLRGYLDYNKTQKFHEKDRDRKDELTQEIDLLDWVIDKLQSAKESKK